MVAIILRELHWQDVLILSIDGFLILMNLGLAGLFFNKYHRKKSTMQLFLGLFQLVSAYVELDYGFHEIFTINDIWDHILEDAYVIGIILLPLLLIRIASEMCKTKPSLLVEIIFFGAKLVCLIPVLLLPTNEIISNLIFIPMAIMLVFVVYFLIYRPHKVKNALNIEDHVLKIALDLVGASGILFLLVLFDFTMFGYFHLYTIKITGFVLYFGFLATVYLGYYNPLWWRKIISHTGECQYCYGEFDECLVIRKPISNNGKVLDKLDPMEKNSSSDK
ncbi:MAG: hypothetical protein JW776_11665 [Candidatus Lokiarchaeota archaeon]|nr:hypothetical protein [Candidatus Lokiarchaeota archaeon]